MADLFSNAAFSSTPAPLGITLRDYQREAVDAIHQWFEGHDGNPLIVAPTGSGKSVILTAFVHGVLSQWPTERILVLTHVRELIAQNHSAMLRIWPDAPAGICSAGIGKREWNAHLLFAGIQTVYKHAAKIGWTDLVIIDEAHLIPSEGFGMYRTLLDALCSMNSRLKVIGLTATPFRTDSGRLDDGEGRIFHGIAFDCALVRLIEEGYLAKIVCKHTAAGINTDGVHVKLGEFVSKELEHAAMQDGLVARACDEIVARSEGRRSMLLFGCGVKHAESIRDHMIARGIECACVFGTTSREERDAIVARFKAGELRAVSNFGVLTTGFDAPNIDLIALLRPTKSPVLYVQMVGRGLRIAPGKQDCLVLDFGGNVMRHGPIDLVRVEQRGKREEDDEEEVGPPVKACPECGTYVLIAARECPDCGYVFPIAPPHEARPDDDAEIISGRSETVIERWDVTRVSYREHHKEGKPTSLRVDYEGGWHRKVSEWVCFEHDGFARKKAEQWWRSRGGKLPFPATVDQARVRIEFDELRKVVAVTVDNRSEYPKVLGVTIEELEAGANEPNAFHDSNAIPEDLPF
jgi:DNA repair protein RadD